MYGVARYEKSRRASVSIIIALAAIVFSASTSFAADQDSTRILEARKGIDAGNALWITAHKTVDSKLVASLFTSDGALLVRGGHYIRGLKAIEKAMGEYMTASGPIEMTITTLQVWVVDSTAYEYGKYTQKHLKPGSDSTTVTGHYFEIWQQQPDGTWKIFRDTGLPKE
jgi:uncharacterized protein (TIGR02246 family)